jgi:hypothetical protein
MFTGSSSHDTGPAAGQWVHKLVGDGWWVIFPREGDAHKALRLVQQAGHSAFVMRVPRARYDLTVAYRTYGNGTLRNTQAAIAWYQYAYSSKVEAKPGQQPTLDLDGMVEVDSQFQGTQLVIRYQQADTLSPTEAQDKLASHGVRL